MQVTINGKPAEVAEGATLASWAAEAGRDPRTMAIERNGAIVPRGAWASTPLAAGDKLEIVQFVQGG